MDELVQPTIPRRWRKRPGRRPLRGEKLVRAAQAELERMARLSPKTDRITVVSLATRLGVGRTALYNHRLQDAVVEYAALQRKQFSIDTEQEQQHAVRRSFEERLQELERENQELKRKLDGWIERWKDVERNAHRLGIKAELIFAPTSPPAAHALVFKRGGRRGPRTS